MSRSPHCPYFFRPMATNQRTKGYLANKFRKVSGFEWPGWARMTIWTSVILLLTGKATYDFYHVLIDYWYNNESTQIEVIMKDETISKPHLTLCLPYYSRSLANIARWLENGREGRKCIECEFMKNRSWDVWNENQAGQYSHHYSDRMTRLKWSDEGKMAARLIRKLLDHGDNTFAALKLNSTLFNWNQPIVDAVWRFFAAIYFQDLLAGHVIVDGNIAKSAWELMRGFDFKQLGQIPDPVLDQLFDRLIDSLQVCVKDKLDSDSTFWTTSGIFLFHDKVCFPLQFEGAYPYMARRYSYRCPVSQQISQTKSFVLYQDLPSLYSLLEEEATEPLIMERIGHKELILEHRVEKSVIETRQRSNCSHEKASMLCDAKHRFDTITQYCKCIPFAFRHFRNFNHNHNFLPYCNETFYSGCWKELSNRDVRENQCWNRCEYTFYKWKKVITELSDPAHALYLEISPGQEPYVRFTLTEKNSFEQFLGLVGGVFGLYLGFSGLTICAILFSLIDLINRWRDGEGGSVGKETGDEWSMPAINQTGQGEYWEEDTTDRRFEILENSVMEIRNDMRTMEEKWELTNLVMERTMNEMREEMKIIVRNVVFEAVAFQRKNGSP